VGKLNELAEKLGRIALKLNVSTPGEVGERGGESGGERGGEQ
jgi:hypothetical protein